MITKCEGRFVETEVDGEVVVMNVETGLFYSLEGTALAIWQAIDGTRDTGAITALLCTRFDEGADVIGPEVAEFVVVLAEAGLVRDAGGR